VAEEVAAIQEGWDRLGHRRGRRDDQWYPGVFFVKTDAEILDGLLGTIWAKRMYVSILAVQEPFRSKGYGTGVLELLSGAEQYAVEGGSTDCGSPLSASRRGHFTSG
jgi:GNAT superfamily N-acetyltransferase